MFAVAELTVVGAALGAGDAVLIDAVRIDGLDVDLNERLIKQALEGGGPDASGAEAPATARGSTLPPFRLGALTIGGGSRLAITDIVAGDLFRVDVGLEQLQIGPIDLADPTERTAFDLRLSINEITSISLAGTARPFSKPPDLDIDALIDNLPVAPFSPYLEQQLGLVLLGGALSSRLDATAEDGALNGHVTMILRDFQLEPMSREADEAFRDKFVVSPNYVVSLLRDGDGDIDLDFPISGTIDDPDVDLSSLTGKAVGGALVSLIPFNWFDDDEWETKDVTVAFPPGSAKLAAGLHDLLDHAGRKLKADTETPVLLCGIATDADIAQLRGVDAGDLRGARQATREEITAVMEIAAAREAAIREFLSVNHSVIGSRIGQCQTEYIPGMSLPPRAVFRVAVD